MLVCCGFMTLCIYNVNFREDPSPRILVVALFFLIYFIILLIILWYVKIMHDCRQAKMGGFPYPYGLFKK